MTPIEDAASIGRSMKVRGEISGACDLEVQGDIFATHISIEDGAALCGHLNPSRATEAVPEPFPAIRQLKSMHQSLDAWLAPESNGRSASLAKSERKPVLCP